MSRQALYLSAYALGAAWLLGWEISAIATGHPEVTISDFTWQFEGVGVSLARAFVAVTLVILTLHLSFGWFH